MGKRLEVALGPQSGLLQVTVRYSGLSESEELEKRFFQSLARVKANSDALSIAILFGHCKEKSGWYCESARFFQRLESAVDEVYQLGA
jgi:predicted DNA-binding ribbon-helix-helix protein